MVSAPTRMGNNYSNGPVISEWRTPRHVKVPVWTHGDVISSNNSDEDGSATSPPPVNNVVPIPDWWWNFEEYDRLLLPGRIVPLEEIEAVNNQVNEAAQEVPVPAGSSTSNSVTNSILHVSPRESDSSIVSGSEWSDYETDDDPEWIINWVSPTAASPTSSPFVTDAEVPSDLYYRPETNIANFAKQFPFNERWMEGLSYY